jgi:hypothetical protein
LQKLVICLFNNFRLHTQEIITNASNIDNACLHMHYLNALRFCVAHLQANTTHNLWTHKQQYDFCCLCHIVRDRDTDNLWLWSYSYIKPYFIHMVKHSLWFLALENIALFLFIYVLIVSHRNNAAWNLQIRIRK